MNIFRFTTFITHSDFVSTLVAQGGHRVIFPQPQLETISSLPPYLPYSQNKGSAKFTFFGYFACPKTNSDPLCLLTNHLPNHPPPTIPKGKKSQAATTYQYKIRSICLFGTDQSIADVLPYCHRASEIKIAIGSQFRLKDAVESTCTAHRPQYTNIDCYIDLRTKVISKTVI